MNQSPKNRKRLGQALVEFTFVGIPLIFVLISVFEVSRGMWIYHTLAYSVKNGVRYASVHGINCVGSSFNPNSCTVNMGPSTTAGTVAYVIAQAAVGLDPASTTVTFTDASGSTSCALSACGTTGWPTADGVSNGIGQPIRIDIRTPFNNAISMLFPGKSGPVSFANGTLGASSQDYIQF